VKLQAFFDGAWETIDLDKPNRHGKYTTSWTPQTPGTYQLRARIAAGTDQKGKPHSEGISATFSLTVS
jgi:hypothetical protein